MSKEAVAAIARAITDAKGARTLRDQQGTSARQVESVRQGTERRALVAQNEARLRATGVVALFEELRNSGTLKLEEGGRVEVHGYRSFLGIELPTVTVRDEDYKSARIQWGPDRLGISIQFDKYSYYVGPSNEDQETPVYYEDTLCLEAKIAQNGALVVGQSEMKPGEELETVVRKEIIKLKEHKWEQQSKAPKS